jgi:hypothetical protein
MSSLTNGTIPTAPRNPQHPPVVKITIQDSHSVSRKLKFPRSRIACMNQRSRGIWYNKQIHSAPRVSQHYPLCERSVLSQLHSRPFMSSTCLATRSPLGPLSCHSVGGVGPCYIRKFDVALISSTSLQSNELCCLEIQNFRKKHVQD